MTPLGLRGQIRLRVSLPARSDIELTLRAFSDPVRLRLLTALRVGELRVCDLMAVVVLPQATVSRHLACLGRAGFIEVRRDRSWRDYTLAQPATRLQVKLREWLDEAGTDMPLNRRDFTRAHRFKKEGGCC